MTSREDEIIAAIFDVPIYIRDGDAVHAVWTGTGRSVRSTDHDMEYEEAWAAFGGTEPPCLKFYKAVREYGFRGAFFGGEVFSASIRIRIFAEWIKLISPLYDALIEDPIYVEIGGSPRKRTSCYKLADLTVKFLDKYIDPNFDVPDQSYEDDEWSSRNDVSAIIQPVLFKMLDSIPVVKVAQDPEAAPFRLAYHTASALEYLQRACGWRLGGFSAEQFECCDEVHHEADECLKSINRAMVQHMIYVGRTAGQRSDMAVHLMFKYGAKIAGLASRITRKYTRP